MVMTDAEVYHSVQLALRRLDLTWEELLHQAFLNKFQSDDARNVWETLIEVKELKNNQKKDNGD